MENLMALAPCAILMVILRKANGVRINSSINFNADFLKQILPISQIALE
jgi:hypothetical protein